MESRLDEMCEYHDNCSGCYHNDICIKGIVTRKYGDPSYPIRNAIINGDEMLIIEKSKIGIKHHNEILEVWLNDNKIAEMQCIYDFEEIDNEVQDRVYSAISLALSEDGEH